ncbi:MAG: putative selenate ABC transporter substrate-binding protein [Planctomycetota bacterium]|nr:putative selenate ABC transporter substrate-binding protein [Planctomycetota bacterium]MDA1113715.1 putative selenate ABC transporter substrate-binding protein [Planctomycetota bacterium]
MSPRSSSHLLPFGVLAFILALAACGGTEKESNETSSTLYFTAIPDHDSTELEAKFQPVAAYLSEQLGVPVEYVPTADYSASVEMFRNGDVQLAWFGGLSGVQARSTVDGSRAIAQGKSDPEFVSYFVVNGETSVQKSDSFPMGLEGMSFTFGSPQSTSGRLMPEHFIVENTGRSPKDFFGAEAAFSGSHDKTAKLVEAGTFQAGAMNYKTYDLMVAEGQLDAEKCRIAWVTPTYPDYNWTAHPALDQVYGEGFVDKVQTALLNMTDANLLKAIDREEGLILAENKDFDPIVELASKLGFLN